jgi:hypothetical protein
MRLLLAAAFWVSQVTGVLCETHSQAIPSCFASLSQETVVGDSITLTTSDNTVIRGVRPIVIPGSLTMHLWRVADSGTVSSELIPFDRIGSITYRKPSGARGVVTLMGLGIGCFAGVVTTALISEGSIDFDSMDFASLGAVFAGGMVGAVVGAVGGNAIGKRITVKVTLECL